MFNLSTQDVVLSIKNTPLVNLDGILYQEYHNFFDNDRIETLEKNVDNLRYQKLEKQFDMNRKIVDYNEDLMKKIKIFFMHSSITNELEKKFETDLNFESVDIWLDGPGYYLPPHTDDTRIKLALQIYLGNDNVGTSLFDQNKRAIKTFSFKVNSGYALLNNKNSLHGLTNPVTKASRISLYARYN